MQLTHRASGLNFAERPGPGPRERTSKVFPHKAPGLRAPRQPQQPSAILKMHPGYARSTASSKRDKGRLDSRGRRCSHERRTTADRRQRCRGGDASASWTAFAFSSLWSCTSRAFCSSKILASERAMDRHPIERRRMPKVAHSDRQDVGARIRTSFPNQKVRS